MSSTATSNATASTISSVPRTFEASANKITKSIPRRAAMVKMAGVLREYREQVACLTQDDAAQTLGLSRMTYQRMEAASPGTSIEAWMRAFQWMNALPTLTHLSAARHAASAAWAKHVVEQAAEQRKANDARLGITRPPPQWGRVYEKPTP